MWDNTKIKHVTIDGLVGEIHYGSDLYDDMIIIQGEEATIYIIYSEKMQFIIDCCHRRHKFNLLEAGAFISEVLPNKYDTAISKLVYLRKKL